MVVSGVNDGANLGDDVLYSGTVAAAIEGRFLGLPTHRGVAVHRSGAGGGHFATGARSGAPAGRAAAAAARCERALILNVNVPDVPFAQLRGLSRQPSRLPPSLRAGDARAGSARPRRSTGSGAAGAEQDAGPGTDFRRGGAGLRVGDAAADRSHAARGAAERSPRWLDGLMTDARLSGIGMTSARTRDRLVQRLREQGIANLAGARPHPQRAAAHLRRRGARQPRLRGHRAADRLRPDDLAALHRGAHDRGAARGAARPDNVLEVGTGCGYQTAVLAPLVDAALHHRAHRAAARARPSSDSRNSASATCASATATARSAGRRTRPSTAFWSRPRRSPCRRRCSSSSKVGGRLIVPVGPEGEQQLVRFTRREQRVERESLGAVAFVPLLGGTV